MLLVSFIVKKVYVFQTDPHFESVRLGNIWDICLYGLLFAAVFSVLLVELRASTGWCTTPWTISARSTTSTRPSM